jgi:hypothetical protein
MPSCKMGPAQHCCPRLSLARHAPCALGHASLKIPRADLPRASNELSFSSSCIRQLPPPPMTSCSQQLSPPPPVDSFLQPTASAMLRNGQNHGVGQNPGSRHFFGNLQRLKSQLLDL